MERPAHTAPFQPIWNHPAEENGQNVNLGSTGDNLDEVSQSSQQSESLSEVSQSSQLSESLLVSSSSVGLKDEVSQKVENEDKTVDVDFERAKIPKNDTFPWDLHIDVDNV